MFLDLSETEAGQDSATSAFLERNSHRERCIQALDTPKTQG